MKRRSMWAILVAGALALCIQALQLDRIAGAQEPEAGAAETPEAKALAVDPFDGKLSLDWDILKPDDTHFSLSKNPGMLTITTQDGQFSRANADYENLFLVECPPVERGWLQVTTRLVGFEPVANFNQAGLIFYNDDDNYFKWAYEKCAAGIVFTVLGETDGRRETIQNFGAPLQPESVWLRMTKRGKIYLLATSLDGQSFHQHGAFSWGDGSPERIGVFANNGSGTDAPEIDARFDVFEIRNVPDPHPLAFDDFDGKLGLGWQILHPDDSHYSLSKNPGKLTITTQRGGFAMGATDYKNLFLIDVPEEAGEDFQVMADLTSFRPQADWNQAGLVFFNDDDNNLKLVYEWNAPQRRFTVIGETDGERRLADWLDAPPDLEHVWLRVTKQGNRYRMATSTDGNVFRPYGERIWGDGSVKRVGLVAKNGPGSDAPEIDAVFDSFTLRPIPALSDELRPPPPQPAPEPMITETGERTTDFRLKALDGREVPLFDKVVFLHFWARWAPLCEKEMAALDALARDYPDDLVVVGVSVEVDEEDAVKAYVKAKKVTYPFVLLSGAIREAVQTESGKPIDTIPTTVVVGRDGRIKGRLVGRQRRETLEWVYRSAAGIR